MASSSSCIGWRAATIRRCNPDRSRTITDTGTRTGDDFLYGVGLWLNRFNDNISIAPLPVGGAGAPLNAAQARGLFISAKTVQPQACREGIKFLFGDVSLMVFDMPARRLVAQSEAFLKLMPPERVEYFEAVYATLTCPTQTTGDIDVFFSQYTDPRLVLQRAQQRG
ncbi:hypothetical protein [Roseiflexus sp.]|uniref:hypothetical protein n=1 Tax=Roseiflexus sp. TaxID=2562120 RepID=UPI00398AE1F6